MLNNQLNNGPHGMTIDLERDRVADATTGPKDCEIKITPEMIEAGRGVISSRWLDFTGPNGDQLWGEVLRGVFLEMLAAAE